MKKAIWTRIVPVIAIAVVSVVMLAGLMFVMVQNCGMESEGIYTPYPYNRSPASLPSDATPYGAPESPYYDTFFQDYGTNPFISTEDTKLSTFGVDVDTASYSITRSYIHSGYLPPEEAVRVEEFVNYFDYEYPDHTGETFKIYVEGADSQFGSNGEKLIMIGIKGRAVPAEERKPAVLTFVIDVSGSMSMDNRLGLVKRSMNMLVDNLHAMDSISIVVYGSNARVALERTPLIFKETIKNAINSLSTEGSTNAEAGLRLGYQKASEDFVEGANNRVILCSDGVANVGITDPNGLLQAIEESRAMGIYLSTFGFGMSNYNDILMEQLANNGDGNYAYIDTEYEARRIFAQEVHDAFEVIAKDVKVQVEFDEGSVEMFRLIGYENRLLNEEDFRDDAVDSGEVCSRHSVIAFYEIKTKDSLNRDGGIFEIRLRYEIPEMGIEEISKKVFYEDIDVDFAAASARFQFTTAVVEFAEILRASPFSDNSLTDVLRIAESSLEELNATDVDVQFVSLVKKCISIMSRFE